MKDYTNTQIAALIDEYIHNDRDRRIMKRRLIDGICYEPLAEEFEMSDRHIKRIIYKLQDRILKHL